MSLRKGWRVFSITKSGQNSPNKVCAATHLCVRPHTQPQTPSTSHPIQFMDGYLFIHSFRCSLPSLYFLSLNHQPRTLWRLHIRDLLHLQADYSGKHLNPKLKTHHVHHIHHPLKVYGRTPSYGGSTHSKLPSMKSIHFKNHHMDSNEECTAAHSCVRPHTPTVGPHTHVCNHTNSLAAHTLKVAIHPPHAIF